ncbi:hypothetical protein FQP87_03625 [Vibrio tasmaniensis]|uniref:hypothetical protein n=1 Tax=Vibrio crassostreae TaxID=246167 RepID=UPI00118F5DB6|nr:hypothetical protein [Vibrio crassostreae]TVU57924.1 hypothetical protein FQP88_23710 [Vibrio atlanticus]TVU78450.1 hypothetical protein FQP87_03625 [Vibrio tasmaniensis]
MKGIRLLITMLVFFSSTVVAITEITSADKGVNNSYLVWPKGNESGSFYLFEKPVNGEWKRKGYLQAYTPIRLLDHTGRWINETRKGTSESRYVPFIATNGVSGLIKKSHIKQFDKLRTVGKLTMPVFEDSKIVQPISPYANGEISIYSISDKGIRKRTSFSRSQLDLVLTREKKKVASIDENTRESYLEVTYLMPLAEGGVRVQSGWIKYSGFETKYMLMPIITQGKAFRLPDEVSTFERLKLVWQHWTDPESYEAEKLLSVADKSCNVDLKVIVAGEAKGVAQLKVVEATIGAKGELTYQFPSGSRFSTNLFKDQYSSKHLSSLKKIRCKKDSNHDWYAESISYAYGIDDFSIYQDDVLSDMKEYFQQPKASGGNKKIEAMLELRELDGTELDYFSAYYLLTDYLYDRVYVGLDLTAEQKIRFNAFLIEDIVQQK